MENARKKIESLFGGFGVWEKLSADDWAMLIAENPEYANRSELKIKSVDCDSYCLMEMRGERGEYGKRAPKEGEETTSTINVADPHYRLFADKYRGGVSLFTSREWMVVLSRQPRLFEFAKANGALKVLDDYSKSYIAAKQPSLADKFEIGEKFRFENRAPKNKTALEIRFEEFVNSQKEAALKKIGEGGFAPESITAEMWAWAIEADASAAELCEKFSEINGGNGTGFYAFGRANWLKALASQSGLCRYAKKYGGFRALLPPDWRELLCVNFDLFEPLAAEFGAWKGFAAGDWRDLLVYFIRGENKK